MALPSVTILCNQSANDTPCTNPAGDSNFKIFDTGDSIWWRDGQQMHDDLFSGPQYPIIRPDSGSIEAPKTFQMDASADRYKQVPLAGTSAGGQNGGNTRYVFAAYFSGPTSGTPYLEAWKTSAHAQIDSKWLGGGTPANSAIRAIATTNGAPGSSTWAGTPLAGEESYVALDAGPIESAKYLYWNMKLLIPSTFQPALDTNHVLAIRFLYS